jgi:aspartate kinase
MIVMKFGGSSIATADKIIRVTSLVGRELTRRPVVVVSAHGKTTDNLIRTANRALNGVVATGEIESFHYDLIDELGLNRALIEPLVANLSTLLHGVSLVKELTARTLDRIMSFGERMSTRIVAAAMAGQGVPAAAADAFEIGLKTTSNHGSALPLPRIDEDISRELEAFDMVPVVTGFLGVDKKGNITTLGRSGSDFSASIIGAAVDAEEVQIWTDVDGVMTCDPSVDPSARNLPVLSFDEASELAYFGAEVIHQNTLLPVIKKKIPVRVLNTIRPDDPGTKILSEPVLTNKLAKSIVYKEDVCLINFASLRLMSAAALLGKALEALSDRSVVIRMATTSEATVSMVTDQRYDEDYLRDSLLEFEQLGRVSIESKKAIICVIGEELKGRTGVLGKIFSAVSEHGIKAKMVSQSASEINVAFLVDNTEIEPTVRALHRLIT